MIQYYALHDFDKTKRGMIQINQQEVNLWQKKGYGIHWSPQTFKDGVRKLENLEKINYWIADIDVGDKEKTLRLIDQLPIAPTIVVETKRGFHIYWRAKDATLENYATIEKGIAEFLHADNSLITPTHTLRVPGSLHLKDPKNPFKLRILADHSDYSKEYNESLMLRCFKPKPTKIPRFARETRIPVPEDLQMVILPENWDRILHANLATPGNRNNQFSKMAYHLKMLGADKALMLNVLLDINNSRNIGLDYREIESIVKGK